MGEWGLSNENFPTVHKLQYSNTLFLCILVFEYAYIGMLAKNNRSVHPHGSSPTHNQFQLGQKNQGEALAMGGAHN